MKNVELNRAGKVIQKRGVQPIYDRDSVLNVKKKNSQDLVFYYLVIKML